MLQRFITKSSQIMIIPAFILASQVSLADEHSSASKTAEEHVPTLLKEYRLKISEKSVKENDGWKKPSQILVSVDSKERLAWMQEAVPDVKLIGVSSYNEAIKANEQHKPEGILGFCNEALIEANENLHWMQIYSAGADRCNFEKIIENEIILSNGQRLSGPEIAEHAIAMMTSLTRGLDAYHIKQLESDWSRSVLPGADRIWEINGRTLLVLGLGGIGTEIAKRGHGLGMKVTATRNSSRRGPEFVSYVGLADEMLTLAAKADVVINALPLTEQTEGLIGEAFFKAMPSHSYYISIGRGQTTDTTAMVNALKSGQIAGVGLDVTDPEPLPADHELWTMPRVLITPHIAWRSDKYAKRRWLMMRENLRRYVNGEPLISVVDPVKGY